MKIAILSKSDLTGGGASRVAQDLSGLLASAGHTVEHWCAWAEEDEARRRIHGPLTGLAGLGAKGLRALGAAELAPIDYPGLIWRARLHERFDIVHVHDISSAISPLTLAALAGRVPLLWTLHDASAFTGGCLYPMGCERYMQDCGACPQRGRWPLRGALDMTPLHLAARRRLHASGRVALAAPSRWMAGLADASAATRTPCRVLPNGIDVDCFRARADKQALRARLGLPEDRTVLLLSAGNLADRRKGIALGVEAIEAVRDQNIAVLLVGHRNAEVEARLAGIPHATTGFIAGAAELAEAYAAADLMIYPSRADNQPLAILEAMACGVPAVGFDVGGVPELLGDGRGLVVADGDAGALGNAVRAAVVSGAWRAWGPSARDYVRSRHGLDEFLSAHIKAYRETIENWKERS